VAPDGSVWFGVLRGGGLGRLRDGKMEFVALPRENARPYTLAADAKGNIWYADISGFVGMIPASGDRQ
jgi:virginiamycin B lyase